MAAIKLVTTTTSYDHQNHLRVSRFSSASLIFLTVTSLLFVTWCYLHVLVINNPNTSSLPTSNAANNTSVELYNESLEYFEAVQAAVKRSEQMKNANLSLRERLGALPNETIVNHQLLPSHRVKRSVLDLASMIKCVTGCNPFMYKDYGCYCGFQGDGYPVDGIDRCCYMHDNCYSEVDCHQALVYFKPYKWGCMKSYHGYGRAKCGMVSSSLCAIQLCECDRKFAKCLSRYRCPKSKASCDITKNINFIIGK